MDECNIVVFFFFFFLRHGQGFLDAGNGIIGTEEGPSSFTTVSYETGRIVSLCCFLPRPYTLRYTVLFQVVDSIALRHNKLSFESTMFREILIFFFQPITESRFCRVNLNLFKFHLDIQLLLSIINNCTDYLC